MSLVFVPCVLMNIEQFCFINSNKAQDQQNDVFFYKDIIFSESNVGTNEKWTITNVYESPFERSHRAYEHQLHGTRAQGAEGLHRPKQTCGP